MPGDSAPKSDDPAWPIVLGWSAEAKNPHRLLEAEDADGVATLASLEGITEWSVLGALARNCAALVVDDWLLVLGAGGAGYPGLREFNGPDASDPLPGNLIVGVDVMGGGFVVNGGGLDCGEPGEVCFLGADDPSWMACGMGHAAWVGWALDGAVDEFYAEARWSGWREDVARLEPGRGISSYPPPYTVEGKREDVSRRPVPLWELWGVLLSTARQLGTISS